MDTSASWYMKYGYIPHHLPRMHFIMVWWRLYHKFGSPYIKGKAWDAYHSEVNWSTVHALSDYSFECTYPEVQL